MTTHEIYTLSDTTPTKLTPDGLHSGMDITLQNVNSSGDVYVGGAGVSSSSYGYKLTPNNAISFELPGTDDLYVIAETDESLLATIITGLEIGN